MKCFKTAQKVADYFGLSLPTAAIAKEVYQNSDVKVTAQPLSGTGTNVDGKNYSGADVVNSGVGYAPFALNYNKNIDKQLSEKGAKPGQIVSGFAKDIVAPAASGKLGLYGLFDSNGKPIQGGNGQTPHETSTHTEYGSFVRLVSPEATITYPNGKTETKPLSEVYQVARYDAPKSVAPTNAAKPSSDKAVATYVPEKPKDGRALLIERMNDILSKIDIG